MYVFRAKVTRGALEHWLADVGPKFVPPPIRAVDGFRKGHQPVGIRVTYPLGLGPQSARRRQDGQERVPRC